MNKTTTTKESIASAMGTATSLINHYTTTHERNCQINEVTKASSFEKTNDKAAATAVDKLARGSSFDKTYDKAAAPAVGKLETHTKLQPLKMTMYPVSLSFDKISHVSQYFYRTNMIQL